MARKSKRESDDRRLMTESTAGIHITGTITAVRAGETTAAKRTEAISRKNTAGITADSMTDVTSRDTVRTDTEETAATVRVIRAAAMTTGTMNRMTEENVQQRKKKRKRITFIIEILILVLLAAGLFVAAKVGKIKRADVSKGDIVINDNVNLKGYTNIALFGVDSREGSLDKEAHSDTILIASINNKTKDVKLVSVYRDTYLDNTNGEYRKATECYYFGGPSRAISMLNKNLDLDITDFVTVDFTAVADVVDALGGIDIDVQEDEIVHLNNYQVEGSQVTGKEIVPVEYAGLQTLNGLQALSYCRIRYTEGSDFKRTERQRTVLQKILEKAKSADLLTLNNLIDNVAGNMMTSLGNTELLSLAKDVSSYNLTDQTGFPFNLTAANLQAGDCVVAVDLADNVRQLHQWLFDDGSYEPSDSVQEISWQIINDTGIQ